MQLLTRRQLTVLIYCASIVLLLVAALIWWKFVWTTPRKVFNDMLANNLRTTSVTKYQESNTTGQKASQYVRFTLGSNNASNWLVQLKQANSEVTTESIGTPTTGYVRYTHVATQQKKSDNKAYNFDNVVNVWGKADAANADQLKLLFSQSLLDVGTAPVPPIGNLTTEHRDNVLQFIHDQGIFMPDYTSVRREVLDGRPVYVYQTQVKLVPYVRMMQAFARDLGLHTLDDINPSQFQSAAPVNLVLKIDTRSHQLREVSYPALNFTEKYSAYGLTTPIEIPTKTIPVSELQNRLKNL
jgi:hypothetical protein